jgi:hypothetical protein
MRSELVVDFVDYLLASRGFFRVLMMQLGLKCPLTCRHCFTNSSPHRTEHMGVDLVRDVIRQYGRIETSEMVTLTGGEPFVYREQLVAALDEIDTFPHLHAHIITNGYWATSLARAIEVLRNLPPIDLISVSADIYHEEFMPVGRVRNVLLACDELEINGALCVCLENGDERYLDRLKQAFGEDLFRQYFRWASWVLPAGRAAEFGTYPKLHEEDIPPISCIIAGSPVVLHDGTVTLCCEGNVCNKASGRPDWPYNFGRVPSRRLGEIYDEMDQDVITQGLRTLGPSRILAILSQAGIRVATRSTYNSICELCMTLMNDPATVRAIRQLLILPAYAREIKLGRIVYFGELSHKDQQPIADESHSTVRTP